MKKDTTITRFEKCPDCSDGSCRKCGPASSEYAAPGVRLVVRHVRFVTCICNSTGCARCGANAHPMAAPGVTIEVIDKHDANHWIPSIHFGIISTQNPNCGDAAFCGTSHVPAEYLSTKWNLVTCTRCKKKGNS
jgi:hypothetical protein